MAYYSERLTVPVWIYGLMLVPSILGVLATNKYFTGKLIPKQSEPIITKHLFIITALMTVPVVGISVRLVDMLVQ